MLHFPILKEIWLLEQKWNKNHFDSFVFVHPVHCICTAQIPYLGNAHYGPATKSLVISKSFEHKEFFLFSSASLFWGWRMLVDFFEMVILSLLVEDPPRGVSQEGDSLLTFLNGLSWNLTSSERLGLSFSGGRWWWMILNLTSLVIILVNDDDVILITLGRPNKKLRLWLLHRFVLFICFNHHLAAD